MANGLIQQLSNQFRGKKVLVVGLGLQEGGVGLARFFSELGAKVTVTDIKSKEELLESIIKLNGLEINYSLGGHKREDFLESDVIFKGPSVPWDHEYIVKAEAKSIPIEMEISFTVSHLKSKIIGITGTRGKTTIVEMIHSLLQKTGKNVYKAGNLSGISTINLLKDATEDDLVVLELSSWSLSGFHKRKTSPNIAVFTNFYPDHLNYYRNMDDYFYDKKAIFLYQQKSDYLFINNQLIDKIDETEIKGNVKFYDEQSFKSQLDYLKGEHNKENAAAAYLVGKLFNLSDKQIYDELKSFKPVKYRQEIVKITDGITIVNDSTSTTPTSTIKAIETFTDKPIILILGGHSKHLPFNRLIGKLSEVEYIVLIKGSFTEEVLADLKSRFFNKISTVFDSLEKAVEFAHNFANQLNKESYILFSPGATSFAMFKNEFDRGDKFNEYVKGL